MERKDIEHLSFKHNFLKEIILRLDFQGVLQGEMDKILMKIKPYLKSKGFGRYEQQINNEINVNYPSHAVQ